MTFRVQWSRRALEALAKIWIDHNRHQAQVLDAAANASRLLETDPHLMGESRDEDRRVVFVPPLAVFYRVDMRQQVVQIFGVRHFYSG